MRWTIFRELLVFYVTKTVGFANALQQVVGVGLVFRSIRDKRKTLYFSEYLIQSMGVPQSKDWCL